MCGRPGRAVAGLEDHRLAGGLAVGPALEQLARFLVGPGLGRQGGGCGGVSASNLRCSSVLVRAKVARNGRSFAASRAPRNPCRDLAGRRDGEVREATAARRSRGRRRPRTSSSTRRWSGSGSAIPSLAGSTCSSCSPSSIRRGSRCRPRPGSAGRSGSSRRRARPRPPRRCGASPTGCSAVLADPDWPEREGAWTSNATLHRLGWGWAPLIGGAARAARTRRAHAVRAAEAMGGSGRAAAAAHGAGRSRRTPAPSSTR